MKRALITGVTGQDGSYLSELLLNKGYEVYGMVRMSSVNNLSRLSKSVINSSNFHICHGDLTDTGSLYRILDESGPDEIYNLAAQSYVGLSCNFEEYTTEVNALGVLRLLNSMDNLKLNSKFYQAVTSDMFGNNTEEIINENIRPNPGNPYACSKAYAMMIANIYRTKGCFVVNGIEFPHESERRSEKFVTRKITKAAVRIKLGKQKKLSLGNLDVQRDWGHAKDYVLGMWLSMQKETSDDYVFATGIATSLRDLCIKIFSKLDINIEFKGAGADEKAYNKDTGGIIIDVNPEYCRKNEKYRLTGDYSKAKKVLNWSPKYSIDDVIDEMIKKDLEEETR